MGDKIIDSNHKKRRNKTEKGNVRIIFTYKQIVMQNDDNDFVVVNCQVTTCGALSWIYIK